MDLTRRLPGLLLAVVAIVLTVVIAGRVSAGADPAPQDTTPIVIAPPAASSAPAPTPVPTSGPGTAPDDDDDDDRSFDRSVPEPRAYDDDDDEPDEPHHDDD